MSEWVCPGCGKSVGSERVLELKTDGSMVGWHPQCYLEFEASR